MNGTKEGTPWKVKGKWSVSKHCFDSAVREDWHLPKSITIHDCTLRDGEQTPGVVFRKNEKLKIAHALEEAGVQRIEGGMASISKEDADAIRSMAKEIKHSEIASFVRARQDDIDLAIDCNVQRGVIEIPAVDSRIKNIWGSREKAVETIIKLIRYANDNGLKVTYFLLDCCRADIDLLRDMIVPVVENGKPDSVAIVDTRGSIYPPAMSWLVSTVREWVRIPIEVHCHNVWGLGTANTLAGVTAGAEIIHTCINGMGGNAPLEECVMGTEALLGLKTGIKTERFREISAMTKKYSRADWYKPFVGTLSSQTETGIGISEMWKNRDSDEPGYGRAEPFNYETVGGKAAEVVLGKKSGKASILFKMWELNLPAPPDEQISEILEKVKRYGIQKKRWLKESEFCKIYTDITGKTI